MIEKRDFFINGTWVKPIGGRDCLVIDPSTEEPCAVISLGSEADTDRKSTRLNSSHIQKSRMPSSA